MKRKRKGPTFIQIYNESELGQFSFTKLVGGMFIFLLVLTACKLVSLLAY